MEEPINEMSQLRTIPRRIAMLSMHTSPLAALGGSKTGGMNVYVREVAAALARRGIHVDVFTRENAPEAAGLITPLERNARVIYLPGGPAEALEPNALYPFLPRFRDAVAEFTQREGLVYDLIFSHYWLSGWVARHLSTQWNVPFVQMFHTLGTMKERITDYHSGNTPHGMITPIQNRRIEEEMQLMQSAQRLVAATAAERMQMLWLYRADRRRIVTISPGVDLKQFYPLDRHAARQAIGLQAYERMLLFVGRIEPLKGVDTILTALAKIQSEQAMLLKNVCLYVVGGDPQAGGEMSRLQSLRHDLRLQCVEFIGAKDHASLLHYYNAAEALLMPSDYESFGMVALEALACGTPVIASQVGGLAFLVRDGENGFLVPARDSEALATRIASLLRYPQLRDRMGQIALQTAQEYSWNQIVDHLLQVFTEVLAQYHPVTIHS